jgi:hypothetical protein
MDPQVEALIQVAQQEIVALTQRVATLEQAVEHMRDMVSRMSDHVGFSHSDYQGEH